MGGRYILTGTATTIHLTDGATSAFDILSVFPSDKSLSHNYYAKQETDVVAAMRPTPEFSCKGGK